MEKWGEEEWVKEKTWEEFRKTGLLWFVNRTLHLFGWVIAFNYDTEGNLIKVCPARTRFRGFDRKSEEEGYIKLTKYIDKNSEELVEELVEETKL